VFAFLTAVAEKHMHRPKLQEFFSRLKKYEVSHPEAIWRAWS
jgi:hypothetical protein